MHHLGPVGAGHTAKLLNNFLNAVTLAATAEVMVAGQRAGLDLRTLLAAINGGSGQSFASSNRFPRIVEGDYLEGGLTSRLMTKDVTLYTELLARLGVPSLNAAGPVASLRHGRPPRLRRRHLATASWTPSATSPAASGSSSPRPSPLLGRAS